MWVGGDRVYCSDVWQGVSYREDRNACSDEADKVKEAGAFGDKSSVEKGGDIDRLVLLHNVAS